MKFCGECGTPLRRPQGDTPPAPSYADLQRVATEALEQQTATADILKIISTSPTDIQPVLDAVAESAARLCESIDAEIFRREGDQLLLVAHHGPIPSRTLVVPLVREAFNGRTVLDGRTFHVADLQAETDEFPRGSQIAQQHGTRTQLSVPLMREGVAIGTISLRRTEVRLFTDRQVALLQTFADQAVIAIENVRLFNELEARNLDLTQALEQQTATSEILRVIGSSPTDTQPVFDAIVVSARRLLGGFSCGVYRRLGDDVDIAAYTSTTPAGDAAVRSLYPRPLDGFSFSGEAIRTGSIIVSTDIETDPRIVPEWRAAIRVRGFRSAVWVPMLREGAAIGAIGVTRSEPGAFGDEQIALLKTFADQAMIAVENVRLFEELQASNRELRTALDTQTATSDILGVISRSPTDVQPVFDAILASAVRLLGAYSGVLTRIAGDQIVLAALTSSDDAGDAATRALFPQALEAELSKAGQWDRMASGYALAIRQRGPVNVADANTDPRWPEAARAYVRLRGYRSWAAVPMLRHDGAIGTISVTRREPGGFTDDEIALLRTFADQAVIAIENVRLFTELQARTGELTRSVGELRALGEVSQALSSTLDVDVVLNTIVTRANDLLGADGCTIFEYDEGTEQFHLRATRNLEPGLVELARGTPLRKGDQGILGQLPLGRQAVQVPDITAGSYSSPISDALIQAGYRAVVAVPLIREDHLIGALTMNRKTPGEFAPETMDLLQTFATQSALAIQNARLFREIEQKSRELEAASQHKSEFLANMSHELRTPLNAIIGFSEVLEEEAGDLDGGRLVPDLQKIAVAAKHQLSLINDILDLSKVEAGRMELEITAFDLDSAIDNALTLVRERASRRDIALGRAINEQLGTIHADERKVKQVLLNLLSNALKFTPEGGHIDVRAAINEGIAEISVTDTGVGIAPEDQETIFEEFRQVGTADKKVEGTGLRLALARKFIELHGGRIWVKSQIGQGSTFTFTLPALRAQ